MDGALNRFKLVMRLSISSDNCILGFLDAEAIDSLLDNVVVDLSFGGGEGHIKMTSSSSSLFSLGGTIGLTRGSKVNQLVLANDSCNPRI